MYTAIINEDNNEKLCKANDILGNNYYPQKQIVNKENSTNNVSDISLNEFSYSESSDIPNCIISDFEAPLTFHKCNCSEEGKSKKTVYTQRGNVIEWEVIQEENIYDDFSFQISSSDDK
ncbi:Hypothetical protein SRAE_1000095700 [Strongyloides ratti]|uniref:Uncharacterized protein n=1 Tax=Strongyloides ratti TaxID=34506 RepID=A0A090L3P6_STRRB|nr:Hypothetical protein SRAE_1000095700 [Strongyloides ratti]CEF62687.1 Hypothetical protein SRAE_1000095700 [Strongyloides ratti]